MNEAEKARLIERLKERIAKSHWFGEGAGGSGHMACIYPGNLRLEEVEESGPGPEGRKTTRVVYGHEVIRESEFGGSITTTRNEAVVDGSLEILSERTLDVVERDLLEAPCDEPEPADGEPGG